MKFDVLMCGDVDENEDEMRMRISGYPPVENSQSTSESQPAVKFNDDVPSR